MAIVTGDRYLEQLVKFVERNAGPLLEGTLTVKLNPVGLHYVQSRLDALQELEGLLAGAPVDYLRAYVSDLGDHRALEQLRRILGLLTSLKVISVLPLPARDPTPLSIQAFGRLKVLELRGCDLSTSPPRGLLELRHTLEKLICHNSTDALRHVFASRIADIKDSPVWKRLTFVSCALNRLVLMDESLRLLPVVETLDLSRNQFAKVDNLWKSSKLRHLDLGFNHLRSIASLRKVSCPIVKLVLRNNVLTTLRGLENLKSVEGLDLSYNLISNFSEMEILANLPCLQNFWLEGNPICCARWYRAYVFSYFSHPEMLILDDNRMSAKEHWERYIILTSRQKQPPAYGCYFPAKGHNDEVSSPHANKKKYSRLANIEDDEHRRYLCIEGIEQDSLSCDSDMFKKDEKPTQDDESNVFDLMTKAEHLKKEKSVFWLRELMDWMDQSSKVIIDSSKQIDFDLDINSERRKKQLKETDHLGESSRYNEMSQEAEGGIISNKFEHDTSLTDNFSCGNGIFDKNGRIILDTSAANEGQNFITGLSSPEVNSEQDQMKGCTIPQNLSSLTENGKCDTSSSAIGGRECSEKTISSAPLTAIDEIFGSQSSATFSGSPPHFQEGILHRRLCLEEEFLQLSAGSCSVESSDSDTSSSDDESCGLSVSISENDCPCSKDSTLQPSDHTSTHLNNHLGNGCEESYFTENMVSSCEHHTKLFSARCDEASSINNNYADAASYCSNPLPSQDAGDIERINCKQQLKRGFASLFGNLLSCNNQPEFDKANGTKESHRAELTGVQAQSSCSANGCNYRKMNAKVLHHGAKTVPVSSFDRLEQNEYIEDFFNMNVADSEASETCQQIVFCGCIYQRGLLSCESELALLRTSNNFYLLLLDETENGLGTVSRVLGCHRLDEIREVVTGLGLQAVRVNMEGEVTYLFLTRTVETCKDLFGLLQIFNSTTLDVKCSLESWEQIQVDLFEKYVYGSPKTCMYFYSMILFWQDRCEGRSWLSRSLFVIEGYIIVCIENLAQFGSFTDDLGTSPYYCLDSHCLIHSILEVVIEPKDRRCLTLIVGNVSGNIFSDNSKRCLQLENQQSCTWKLMWFSEDYLWRFVMLLKAIHLGSSATTLHVKCAY